MRKFIIGSVVLLASNALAYKLQTSIVSHGSVLKSWDDHTAYVKGSILEDNHGCAFDGACFLRLKVKELDVRVVYGEGDGPNPCVNDQSGQVLTLKVGDWVQAFGSYEKSGDFNMIRMCGSQDYFIRKAAEKIPKGPVTDRLKP